MNERSFPFLAVFSGCSLAACVVFVAIGWPWWGGILFAGGCVILVAICVWLSSKLAEKEKP